MNLNDELVARERQADWLRAAEQRELLRLAYEAQSRQPRSVIIRQWIGQQLVAWGQALQQPATSIAEAPHR